MASAAYKELRSQQADVLRRLPQSLRTWTDDLLKRQARELQLEFPDDVTRRYLYESWVKYFGGEACVGASLDTLVLNCIVSTPSPSNPAVPLFTDIIKGGSNTQPSKGKSTHARETTPKPSPGGEADTKNVSRTKDASNVANKQQDVTPKDSETRKTQDTVPKPAGKEREDKEGVDAIKRDAEKVASEESSSKDKTEDKKDGTGDVQNADKVTKTSTVEVAAVKKDDTKKPLATTEVSPTKVSKVPSSARDEKENRPSADISGDDTSVELRRGTKNSTPNKSAHNKFSFLKWRPSSFIEPRKTGVGGIKFRRSLLETGSAPKERTVGRQPSFTAPSALKFLIYLSKLLEASKENREALDEAGMIIGFCSLLLSLVSFKTRTQVESYFRDRVGSILAVVVPCAAFRGVVPVPNRRFLEVLHEQLTRGSRLQTQISVLVVGQYLYFREAGVGKFPELDMRFLKEGYLNHTIGNGLGALSLLRALQEKTKLNPAAILRFLNSDVTRESCERVEEFLKQQASLAGKKTGRAGKPSAQHTWPWCRVVDQRQHSTLMTRANAFYAVRVVCCLAPPPEDRMWKGVEFVPEEVKRHEREWGDMFRRHLGDGSVRKASDSMVKHRECEWAKTLDSMYFVEDLELLSVGSYKKPKSPTDADSCEADGNKSVAL